MHACLIICVLYKKEYAKLDQCPQCGVSRYKEKDENFEYNNKGPFAKI